MVDRGIWTTTDELRPEDLDGLMGSVRLVCITFNAYSDLKRALGSDETVQKLLVEKATAFEKPIAVNIPIGQGASNTVFMSPATWTEERLKGWVGTYKPLIDHAFGESGRPERPG